MSVVMQEQEIKSNSMRYDQEGPCVWHVIKRDGSSVDFDGKKILYALRGAFQEVYGESANQSSLINELSNIICQKLWSRMPQGGSFDIEYIQDQVELALMRGEQHQVARAYVLYRERRKAERAEQGEVQSRVGQNVHVRLVNGDLVPLDVKRMQLIIQEACQGLEAVDANRIFNETLNNLFDGVAEREVRNAIVMTARTMIEEEPNYSEVAARLLLDTLRSEALGYLGIAPQATQKEMKKLYPKALKAYISSAVELGLIDSKLKTFDLDRLGAAINSNGDLKFSYLGLQTLYDRYFLHTKGTRIELPQVFFMRIAMGLSLLESQKEERAIEFYNLLSSFDFMSSTPTLFNSGTLRAQLSSCFLTTVPDDLAGIYDAIRDNALLSKFAGGLGNDWTPVRGMNAYIKGTNGKSQGVVPFLKVANDTAVAVNQGGKRQGALCSYLETWHVDIEEFLELRKNTGDERRRTHDMNTANWIPDLFMQRLSEEKDWSLFTPNEVPDLHDLFGTAFKEAYERYEAMADQGKIFCKRMPASTLWRKMLTMLFETGHPWMTFKDPCNLRSPQQHTGVVHSSNLCTEITLNTSLDEIAVCNLGSVNLIQHMSPEGKLDIEKLKKTVMTAIRMLDNVIDINYYTVPQARRSNMRHRPIGMGLMGFQDALHIQGIPYDSEAAVEFADVSMEYISYFAIEASMTLSKERGAYETFEGSLWSKGILPIDSINLLKAARGGYLNQDQSLRLDWDSLRKSVCTHGMRNSNVMAIAPTATIANICGVSASIEPTFQNIFVKSNLSGEFTVVNPYLVKDLKAQGLWDKVMVNDLKYFNGSVQQIDRIPDALKRLYATAFEIDPIWLVEAGSRRQKWLDQAQSLNLYVSKPSGKKLDRLYRFAWEKGLKTTYYLRTLGATNTEKSTLEKTDNALNAVKTAGPKVCSIENPDCESCQ